ncbi:MAG TPA: aminopeptidase N [Streptosporangiaceae bacterium]
MAGNLTRDDARERARVLDVDSYTVELDLTAEDGIFDSVSVVRFRCSEPGAGTFIDITAPRVRSVVLNGRHLDPDEVFDGERVLLPGLAADNELRVVAGAAFMRTGEGLHRFVDPVDGKVYLHSQFETADAHRMYACFDQPDLKATFQLTVTAPDDWEVVSNSPAEPPRPAGPGKATWVFPPTPRISPYITALVAGNYHVVRDEYDGIPLGVYCRASLAEHLDPEEILQVTKQGFEFFQRTFGMKYPFAKYDQLFVPEFNAGAMENAGCVTILEDYIFRSRVTDAPRERRAETILHEMAHMWFGDLVTMRWWDDLWLNESFATYMAALCQSEATRWTSAWTTFANVEKAWAYRQDQLPSTHPIAADIVDIKAVEVNFDGITYAKGASVLKQLVAYVGKDEFLSGVRDYFSRHAWSNTELADLLSALEETSGRDLTSWSKEWLETAGVNTLRPVFEVDAEGNFGAFVVEQSAPSDHPTLRTHRIAIGLYDRTTEGIVRRRRVELDVSDARTEVPELVGEKQPDLVLVNDDDLSYAKVRLDPRSLETLVTGIGEIRESLPRALAWSAAWDMCRDAEMPARDYVRLVVSGIRGVTDVMVAQTLLRQARMALLQYTDPAWHDEGTRYLADALAALIREAEPGGDLQLAYTNAFAGVAISDEHLALLRGLLDGDASIDGLAIDADLRWTLLHRLVGRGAAGPAEIDAELERDATATGERRAATCRAAIPTPEGKAAAWARILDGPNIANAVFRATLLGFVDFERPDLLRPYVEKYFEAVAGIWETWTSDMAQFFAEVAYPSAVIDPRTIALTDDYMARNSPPAALRRLLAEGRDGMDRALRAQDRDRTADA